MAKIQHPNLSPAFPQAGNISAKHEIRFDKVGGKRSIHLFASDYSASRFLDLVLKGRSHEYEIENKIVTDFCVITGTTLGQVMDYKETKAEREWRMPEPYTTYIGMIRGDVPGYGTEETKADKSPKKKKKKKEKKAIPDKPALNKPPKRGKKTVEKKTVEKKKKKKGIAKKASGEVTLAQICEEEGWEPRKVRAVLRKLKVEKPGASWTWTDEEADKVVAKIDKEMS